jgi:cation transport regulator ChaB
MRYKIVLQNLAFQKDDLPEQVKHVLPKHAQKVLPEIAYFYR